MVIGADLPQFEEQACVEVFQLVRDEEPLVDYFRVLCWRRSIPTHRIRKKGSVLLFEKF